jgi:hypothetical protein
MWHAHLARDSLGGRIFVTPGGIYDGAPGNASQEQGIPDE